MLQMQWRSLQQMPAEVSAVYAGSSCCGKLAGLSELTCTAVADPGSCSWDGMLTSLCHGMADSPSQHPEVKAHDAAHVGALVIHYSKVHTERCVWIGVCQPSVARYHASCA